VVVWIGATVVWVATLDRLPGVKSLQGDLFN